MRPEYRENFFSKPTFDSTTSQGVSIIKVKNHKNFSKFLSFNSTTQLCLQSNKKKAEPRRQEKKSDLTKACMCYTCTDQNLALFNCPDHKMARPWSRK